MQLIKPKTKGEPLLVFKTDILRTLSDLCVTIAGGITISNTVPLTKIEPEEAKAVLAEYKLSNADVSFRCDATLDELIDVIEGNRIYMPCIYVLNKIDAISIEELDLIYRIPNSVPISAKDWMNIDELIEVMWEKLDLVRVYTRPRGRLPDYSAPVVLRRSACTVKDFADAIHKSIWEQSKYCIVWGASVKHSRGQKCGGEHVLKDEDVVQRESRTHLCMQTACCGHASMPADILILSGFAQSSRSKRRAYWTCGLRAIFRIIFKVYLRTCSGSSVRLTVPT